MSAHVTKEAPGRRPRPFWLRRPAMIARGLRLDRDRPDLDQLNKINDPEEFVWAVLPYAARSFAPTILLLPEKAARTFAVAYLYARMLDTYEDLSPGPVEAQDSLERSPPGFAPILSPSHLIYRPRQLSPPVIGHTSCW